MYLQVVEFEELFKQQQKWSLDLNFVLTVQCTQHNGTIYISVLLKYAPLHTTLAMSVSAENPTYYTSCHHSGYTLH